MDEDLSDRDVPPGPASHYSDEVQAPRTKSLSSAAAGPLNDVCNYGVLCWIDKR